MLDVLRARPGVSIRELSEGFSMSAVGVLKHVRVLEAAGLVVSRKAGRERKLFFNAVPIQAVYDRWTDEYSAFWVSHVADLKERLESRRESPAKKGARRA